MGVKVKTGYGSPNSLEEAAAMLADCKAWREGTDKVNTTLDFSNNSAVTMHAEVAHKHNNLRIQVEHETTP